MSELKVAVPFLDLSQEFAQLEREWFAGLREIGARGSFILGPNVQAFENEFAEYIGVRHAIGVANGTDALLLSLRALGIGPGDEVITTPYSFFATAEVISQLGANPVFVDIDPETYNIDADRVVAAIGDKTRAVMPVHLFGCPADMAALRGICDTHGLALIEDCAQACGAQSDGARVGALGTLGGFSFYPTKVLGCYGDGGMVTTNDSDLADSVRCLRGHGATAHFVHEKVGYNSRLDEVQAIVLRLKLRDMARALDGRRRVASAYNERFRGTQVIVPQPVADGIHAYNLYTIRVSDRDRVQQRLLQQGIGCSVCYPVPLHLQVVYKDLGYGSGSLPVSEQASRECLSLPIYPTMPEQHIDRVCEAILGK